MDYSSIEMEQYLSSHIDPESDLLYRLDRQTHLRTIQPRMLSGHLQGAIMKMIVRMVNPRLVLEIGTFTGYSALAMAEGLLRDDAHIHTIEIDDEMEPLISEFFAQSPHASQLTLHIGDAMSVIDDIPGVFDLVFLDGEKRTYPETYEKVFPRVAHGGFILVDNVLWDGHVLEQVHKPSDRHTASIKRFNDMVAADPRVEKVILPVRDGLSLIRKI